MDSQEAAACGNREAIRGQTVALLRAVERQDWRSALTGMCMLLETAGVAQAAEGPYGVDTRLVRGGWQATVRVPMVGMVVAERVGRYEREAEENAVFETVSCLIRRTSGRVLGPQ